MIAGMDSSLIVDNDGGLLGLSSHRGELRRVFLGVFLGLGQKLSE